MSKLIASEAQEQEALFARAAYHPILREYLYANCNDGMRTPTQGAKFKRRGLKPGVPDITLAYPSYKGYHGLYLELKRKGGKKRVTAQQMEWIIKLRNVGYYANIAEGCDDAWMQLMNYLQPA